MKKISEKLLYQGNWLSLVEGTFKNDRGESVQWESVRRKNQVNACVVVAKLMPSQRFVLIKQYRQSIEGYILGFPAGLIKRGPDQALEELKEETGYSGRSLETSPLFKISSGTTNDNGQVIYAHVDEQDPCNQNLQQQLEPAEEISVHLVKREDISNFIKNEEKQGTFIAANLWYLFILSELVKQ